MELIDMLRWLNFTLALLFTFCYAYQFFYLAVPLVKRDKPHRPVTYHRFAVLISARNEETVLGHLLDSIRDQDYPSDLITAFVVADNCTDATAQVARDHGAVVYERLNRSQVGRATPWISCCSGSAGITAAASMASSSLMPITCCSRTTSPR